MFTKHSIAALAICFVASNITPCICQDSPFFIDDSNENTTPMTSSPQFIRCLADCPATGEYNPICASDMRSYNNPGKLRCAQRCGANIRALRSGPCEGL